MKEKKKLIWKDLVQKSPGKLGRHLPEIRTGTGVKPSKKSYNRKEKHKKTNIDKF